MKKSILNLLPFLTIASVIVLLCRPVQASSYSITDIPSILEPGDSTKKKSEKQDTTQKKKKTRKVKARF